MESPDEGDQGNSMWMNSDPFYDRFPWFQLIGRLLPLKSGVS